MTGSGRQIWVDGELVPWESATVHVLSQSLQRGTLVFDVMAAYSRPGGIAVFGLREHVERLVRSAELSGMRLAFDLDALLAGVAETARANPGCGVIKISAYNPGIALDVLPVDATGSVAIAAFAAEDIGSQRFPSSPRPARLQVADPIKLPPSVLTPQVKIAAGYTAAAIAKRRAREAGFDDILFLDERGRVAESSTQSFFLVEQGALRTAPLEFVLAGITRRCVIEIAEAEGIGCKEEPIERDALETADEAFVAVMVRSAPGCSRSSVSSSSSHSA